MKTSKNIVSEIIGYLLTAYIALHFGRWFANQQIAYVSIDGLKTYPSLYFNFSILKCFLTVLLFVTLTRLIISKLVCRSIPLYLIALTYLPIIFINDISTVQQCVSITLAMQGVITVSYFTACQRDHKKSILFDAIMLLFLIVSHLLFTSRFSPLNFSDALLVAHGEYSEEIAVLAPVYKSYVLAKNFSFTNIDYAQWAGIMNPPVSLASPLLQIMAFILNLPSVSYEIYHAALLCIDFIMIITLSFGCYLYLKYAVKTALPFAVAGGFYVFFGNSMIMDNMFSLDGGIFLSSLMAFSFAILLITYAIQKHSILSAMWAGLFLAMQFYFSSPHPEGVIYSLSFYSIYTLSYLYFDEQVSKIEKIKLFLASYAAFFACSLYFIAPIIYDRLMGNMYVFAHVGDVNRIEWMPFRALFLLYFIILVLTLKFFKRNGICDARYKALLLTTSVNLLFILLAKSKFFINTLIHMTHIGIHFWIYSRMGIYFGLLMTLLTMDVLNKLYRSYYHITKNH